MDTPGLKIVCQPSYEMTASIMGTPFDYPLSSRLDENDAILIFDKVNVLRSPRVDVLAELLAYCLAQPEKEKSLFDSG
ncbi:MAG: hypothetical protein KDJ65_32555 [Anaerolineae bacterium]|nr:hypothetical protein [Anaerolineae bacterium]